MTATEIAEIRAQCAKFMPIGLSLREKGSQRVYNLEGRTTFLAAADLLEDLNGNLPRVLDALEEALKECAEWNALVCDLGPTSFFPQRSGGYSHMAECMADGIKKLQQQLETAQKEA